MARVCSTIITFQSKFNWLKVVSSPTKLWISRPSSTSAVGFNDYEKERKNFRLDVPEYYNFARDVIDSWAEKEKVKCSSIRLHYANYLNFLTKA